MNQFYMLTIESCYHIYITYSLFVTCPDRKETTLHTQSTAQPLHANAPRAPCRHIPSTTDISLLREYNKKYLGLPNYDPHRAMLSEKFYKSYLSLATIGNDISTDCASGTNPRASIPTPHQLKTRGFGNPSPSHTFHQEPTFEMTYVVVVKSGFFIPSDIVALHDTNPLLSHVLSVCTHLRTYNFFWLS